MSTLLRFPSSHERPIAQASWQDLASSLYKRHPELTPKRVKALDWNRHDNNIYDMVTYWFDVIGRELDDPVILPENVYDMD